MGLNFIVSCFILRHFNQGMYYLLRQNRSFEKGIQNLLDSVNSIYTRDHLDLILCVCLYRLARISTNHRNRGSYMSAHVLLKLLNELGKRDKMRGLPSILSIFRNEFNKFNNTRARMLDSIYHMTLRIL